MFEFTLIEIYFLPFLIKGLEDLPRYAPLARWPESNWWVRKDRGEVMVGML